MFKKLFVQSLAIVFTICSFSYAQVPTYTYAFNYTGAMVTFTVPPCVNSLKIKCYGAQGRFAGNPSSLGDGVQGVITVTPGDIFYLTVGGVNGYNGGGSTNYFGFNGGGAADVRYGGTSLNHRILVAGGGGGSGSNGTSTLGTTGPSYAGGNGGGQNGANGQNGTVGPGGSGATGTLGGLAGVGCSSYVVTSGQNGTFGFGGAGGAIYGVTALSGVGGGGGGGYYGGGGGGAGATGVSSCTNIVDGGGGGGGAAGTSYIHPSFTNTLFSPFSSSMNGGIFIDAYSGTTLSVSATSTSVCNGASVTISATGSSMTYSWSNGSTSSSIVVSPTTTTIYTLIASNTSTCVETQTVLINAAISPSLQVIASSSSICPGGSVSLSASGATSFTWSNGLSNGIPFTPSSPTIYTVTSQNFCGSDTKTVSVGWYANPNLSVTGNNTVCANSSVVFTATGANTYTWNTLAISPTIAISPAINSCYTVTGSNSYNCKSSAVWCVTVMPGPTISVSGNNPVCAGSSVTLTASGANTYSWSNGANTPTTVVSPVANSIYTVYGTNQIPCTSTKTVAVTTLSIPIISVSPSSFSNCPNTSGTFTVSGGFTYTWNPSGAFSNMISVSPSVSTIYTVTGKNSSNCVSTSTAYFHVWQLPNVQIAASSTLICKNTIVNLSASGANSYTWGPITGSGNTLSTMPSINSQFYVIGSDINGCSNTASISIIANDCTGLDDLHDNFKCVVYPIPADNFLNIHLSHEASAVFYISDLGGKKLLEGEFTKSARVNIEHLTKGSYVIIIKMNRQSVSKRFEVNR